MPPAMPLPHYPILVVPYETFKETVKHTEWKNVMNLKYEALIRNQTWE